MRTFKFFLYAIIFFYVCLSPYIVNSQTVQNTFGETNSLDRNSGLTKLKENLLVSLGIGFHYHNYQAVNLSFEDAHGGNVTGDVSNQFSSLLSFDIGIYYKVKNKLYISYESMDAFFSSSLRRNSLALYFGDLKNLSLKPLNLIPGFRFGTLRKRSEFQNISTTGVFVEGHNFDSTSLFYFNQNFISIGPVLKLSFLKKSNYQPFIATSFNYNFLNREGLYIKEDKTFIFNSEFVKNPSTQNFLSEKTPSKQTSFDFQISLGVSF